MLDPSSAFDTYLDLNPDLTPSEFEAECQRLVERQKAIALLLDGKLPISVVEAQLAEDGIDPYQWAAAAEDNLIWMLS